MKVDNLSGAALDWAVAECEGKIERQEVIVIGSQLWCREDGERVRFMSASNWSQGGPIIEREGISILPLEDGGWTAATGELYVEDDNPRNPTPLIAAMRCYVASKLGDDVDIDVGVIQTHS